MGWCQWVLVVCIEGALATVMMGFGGVIDGSSGMVVIDGLLGC